MSTVFETTDAAASTATTYEMAVGDVFIGRESQNGSDWIAVTLTAGKTYSFGAVGLGAQDSGVTDTLVRLFNASGVQLGQNDDAGPGSMADLQFQVSQTGTYYVEVRALQGASNGEYGLSVTEGTRPSYDAGLGAGVLYRDGSSWAPAPGEAVEITWGVRASGPARDAQGDSAPFSVLSAAQIAATQSALNNFSDVGNIVFNRVSPGGTTNSATILVGGYTSATDGAGAYAYFPGSTNSGSKDGDLWINNDSVSKKSVPIGSYAYFVFLHELGHAMGLEHPGDYNAAPGVNITYRNSAQFVEDSHQFTVMSYFDATATEPDCPTSFCDTLMLYDITAIQAMYGVNHATRAGNDTYGFNATLGGAYDFTVNDDPLMCIWDGAGKDTLDLSGFVGRQRINLNEGGFSDVGGFKGNLSIAWGALIENAVGGRGADEIWGNAVANRLKGGRGADALFGDGGNDWLTGNGGADDFRFALGAGVDQVTDFNSGQDLIVLRSDLWGGSTKTGAQVISEFAVIRNGAVVLDFGADELVLQGVTSTAGLAGDILML